MLDHEPTPIAAAKSTIDKTSDELGRRVAIGFACEAMDPECAIFLRFDRGDRF